MGAVVGDGTNIKVYRDGKAIASQLRILTGRRPHETIQLGKGGESPIQMVNG